MSNITSSGTSLQGGEMASSGQLLANISFFAPIIVTFGVLFFSLLANVIGKGCWYILLVLFATLIRLGIKSRFKDSDNYNPICNTGNFLPGNNATYSIFILCFTFVYFLGPMIIYNNINYQIIIVFLTYIVFDILIKKSYDCVSFSSPNILLGDFFGGIGLGIASILIMNSTNKNVLFINEIPSNKEICSMPSKQTFKCSVYKNGELVSSSNI
jgi:hypothetical protein